MQSTPSAGSLRLLTSSPTRVLTGFLSGRFLRGAFSPSRVSQAEKNVASKSVVKAHGPRNRTAGSSRMPKPSHDRASESVVQGEPENYSVFFPDWPIRQVGNGRSKPVVKADQRKNSVLSASHTRWPEKNRASESIVKAQPEKRTTPRRVGDDVRSLTSPPVTRSFTKLPGGGVVGNGLAHRAASHCFKGWLAQARRAST